MRYCPMCGKKITDVNDNHLRTLALMKNGVFICNDTECIKKAGGLDKIRAFEGKPTSNGV